jgi:hypothetical protein
MKYFLAVASWRIAPSWSEALYESVVDSSMGLLVRIMITLNCTGSNPTRCFAETKSKCCDFTDE